VTARTGAARVPFMRRRAVTARTGAARVPFMRRRAARNRAGHGPSVTPQRATARAAALVHAALASGSSSGAYEARWSWPGAQKCVASARNAAGVIPISRTHSRVRCDWSA
jgi:hypothetical protein